MPCYNDDGSVYKHSIPGHDCGNDCDTCGLTGVHAKTCPNKNPGKCKRCEKYATERRAINPMFGRVYCNDCVKNDTSIWNKIGRDHGVLEIACVD